jgi:hypothetical protein
MNSNYKRNQSDILRPFSIPQGTEETLKSSSEKSHSFARDNRVSQSYEDISDDVLREFDDDEVFAPNEPFSRNFNSPGIELIEESGPTFGSFSGEREDVILPERKKAETKIVSATPKVEKDTELHRTKNSQYNEKKLSRVFIDVKDYNNSSPLTVCALAFNKDLPDDGYKKVKKHFKNFYNEYNTIHRKKEPERYEEFLKRFFAFIFGKLATPDAKGRAVADITLVSAYGNYENKALKEIVENLSIKADRLYGVTGKNKNYLVVSKRYKESKQFKKYKKTKVMLDNGDFVVKKIKVKDSLKTIFTKNFRNVRFGIYTETERVSYIAWANNLLNLAFNRYMKSSYMAAENISPNRQTQALINAISDYVDFSSDSFVNLGNKYR